MSYKTIPKECDYCKLYELRRCYELEEKVDVKIQEILEQLSSNEKDIQLEAFKNLQSIEEFIPGFPKELAGMIFNIALGMILEDCSTLEGYIAIDVLKFEVDYDESIINSLLSLLTIENPHSGKISFILANVFKGFPEFRNEISLVLNSSPLLPIGPIAYEALKFVTETQMTIEPFLDLIPEMLNSQIKLNVSWGIACQLLLSTIDQSFLDLDLRSFLSCNDISIQCQALRFLATKGCYMDNDDEVYSEEIMLATQIFSTTNDQILQKICLDIPWLPEHIEEISSILVQKPYEFGSILIRSINNKIHTFPHLSAQYSTVGLNLGKLALRYVADPDIGSIAFIFLIKAILDFNVDEDLLSSILENEDLFYEVIEENENESISSLASHLLSVVREANQENITFI